MIETDFMFEKFHGDFITAWFMLINGDFGAAACLITMGAVLGKVSFPQLFTLITIETIFYTLNLTIVVDLLKV